LYFTVEREFYPLLKLDPTLVSQLKETLPAALFEKLNGSLCDRLREKRAARCEAGRILRREDDA